MKRKDAKPTSQEDCTTARLQDRITTKPTLVSK
jgi:hypothetical protein